tara:strand:- start:2642 stop:3463 length:822 start_codon:yes stop_codon:yes gene_type:complete
MVSSVEEARLGEALNAGIARAISDGVPGLTHDTFTGHVLGDLALTGTSATTIGDTVIETAHEGDNLITSGVLPQDIISVFDDPTWYDYLIRDIGLEGGKTQDEDAVDVGAPINAVITGSSASKIIRRGLKLPTSGQVIAVHRIDSSTKKSTRLTYEPLHAVGDPFATGTPVYFEQRYSQTIEASYISLWPAPATTTQLSIIQTRFHDNLSADDMTLRFPEEALDAVLERARLAYLTWSGNVNQVDAALATESVKDVSDSLKNSGNAEQVFVKQ